MSAEYWDGKPRRKNDIFLESLERKSDRTYDFLRIQFGDVDLAGNKVEGVVYKALRELNEKVAIQNGRVKALENRNLFLDGSAKIIAVLFTAGIAVLTVVAMWPRK